MSLPDILHQYGKHMERGDSHQSVSLRQYLDRFGQENVGSHMKNHAEHLSFSVSQDYCRLSKMGVSPPFWDYVYQRTNYSQPVLETQAYKKCKNAQQRKEALTNWLNSFSPPLVSSTSSKKSNIQKQQDGKAISLSIQTKGTDLDGQIASFYGKFSSAEPTDNVGKFPATVTFGASSSKNITNVKDQVFDTRSPKQGRAKLSKSEDSSSKNISAIDVVVQPKKTTNELEVSKVSASVISSPSSSKITRNGSKSVSIKDCTVKKGDVANQAQSKPHTTTSEVGIKDVISVAQDSISQMPISFSSSKVDRAPKSNNSSTSKAEPTVQTGWTTTHLKQVSKGDYVPDHNKTTKIPSTPSPLKSLIQTSSAKMQNGTNVKQLSPEQVRERYVELLKAGKTSDIPRCALESLHAHTLNHASENVKNLSDLITSLSQNGLPAIDSAAFLSSFKMMKEHGISNVPKQERRVIADAIYRGTPELHDKLCSLDPIAYKHVMDKKDAVREVVDSDTLKIAKPIADVCSKNGFQATFLISHGDVPILRYIWNCETDDNIREIMKGFLSDENIAQTLSKAAPVISGGVKIYVSNVQKDRLFIFKQWVKDCKCETNGKVFLAPTDGIILDNGIRNMYEALSAKERLAFIDRHTVNNEADALEQAKKLSKGEGKWKTSYNTGTSNLSRDTLTKTSISYNKKANCAFIPVGYVCN